MGTQIQRRMAPITFFVLTTLIALVSAEPKVMHFNDFNSKDWAKEYNINHAQQVRRVADCRGTGNYCLQIHVRKNEHYGTSIKYKFADRYEGYEPTSLAVKYKIKFARNCNSYNGKAPGFDGTYDVAGWGGKPSNGENGWSARGSTTAKEDGIVPSFYVYDANLKRKYGKPYNWQLDGGSATLEENHYKDDDDVLIMEYDKWHNVTQYVKLNDVGKHNGILAAWVNGRNVLAKKEFQFRTVDKLKLYSYWINFYHGGKDVSPKDCYIQMDDLVLWEPLSTV